MLTILIMAGGSGERFWPLSTPERPKQLLSIFTGKPMIRETVDRVLPLVPIERIFVATNEIQRAGIVKVLPDLPKGNLIIEPAFRDTAAAIGYGSLHIKKIFSDATVAVLASDHLIKNQEAFLSNMDYAHELAKNSDYIVTLGINPTYPETGYGYIEVKNPVLNKETKVIKFKEKPNYDTAVEYLESKNYLWNSGMFIFSIKTIEKAFKQCAPEHAFLLSELEKNLDQNISVQKEIFTRFEKISIDFAIMEKYQNIYLISTDFGWSDVGDFNSLAEIYKSDKYGNVDLSNQSIFVDSDRNIIFNENENIPRICLLGVNDHIIVLTNSQLLIARRSDTQKIKEIIKKIKE